jgi:hypothetical protein
MLLSIALHVSEPLPPPGGLYFHLTTLIGYHGSQSLSSKKWGQKIRAPGAWEEVGRRGLGESYRKMGEGRGGWRAAPTD